MTDSSDSRPVGRSRASFLVVSADSVGRDLLAVLLKNRGFSVREAGNFDEASAALRSESFNGMLLDARRRILGGKDLARQVFSCANGLTCILLCDGNEAGAEKGREDFEDRADAVVLTPFDGDAVVAAVNSSGCLESGDPG